MSGAVHVCGGYSRWARRIMRCPACKRRRRMLSAIVFGGYCWSAICGGCGARLDDGEYRRCGKREAAENREEVRREWPKARTHAEEVAEIMASVRAERA